MANDTPDAVRILPARLMDVLGRPQGTNLRCRPQLARPRIAPLGGNFASLDIRPPEPVLHQLNCHFSRLRPLPREGQASSPLPLEIRCVLHRLLDRPPPAN